jgi:hypothetical protein
MRRSHIVFLAFLLITIASYGLAYATSTNYRLFENQLTNSANANVVYGNMMFAQTICPNETFILSKLMLKCQAINVNNAFSYVNLGFVKGSNISAITLSNIGFWFNITVSQADLPSGGATEYNFTFSTSHTLKANENYTLVITADGTNETNCFAFQSANSNVYLRGDQYHSTNAGVTWDADNADFYFACYGFPSPISTINEWLPAILSIAMLGIALGMLGKFMDWK